VTVNDTRVHVTLLLMALMLVDLLVLRSWKSNLESLANFSARVSSTRCGISGSQRLAKQVFACTRLTAGVAPRIKLIRRCSPRPQQLPHDETDRACVCRDSWDTSLVTRDEFPRTGQQGRIWSWTLSRGLRSKDVWIFSAEIARWSLQLCSAVWIWFVSPCKRSS